MTDPRDFSNSISCKKPAKGDSAEVVDFVENVGVDKVTSMALLKHPDRKINIPRLQPNPPTTEDMLMRREREMTALGGGEEGRKARLKMQSRLLEMDMRNSALIF